MEEKIKKSRPLEPKLDILKATTLLAMKKEMVAPTIAHRHVPI